MYCISINHKNTPANLRERFAWDAKIREALVKTLADDGSGCVVLLTCNRMEMYFTGEDEHKIQNAEERIAEYAELPVSTVRKYSMSYTGKGSVVHLCKVACGMDSMVLGEVEIIRQIKDAYLTSKELGCTDGELNLVFQGALAVAKTAASQGASTRLPVSVGTLTAREAVRFCKEQAAGRGDRSDVRHGTDERLGRILIVGITGRTGSIVANDIADMAQEIELVGTGRHRPHPNGRDPKTPRIRFCEFEDRYREARLADVVVSATSSPHYIFTADELAKVWSGCEKKRLLLDLAMPRDIDPEASKLSGCTLHDIDYIHELAKENNECRMRSLRDMLPYVEQRADEIQKNVVFSGFCREHEAWMAHIKTTDGGKMIYRMKDTMSCKAFEEMLDGILSVYDRIEE